MASAEALLMEVVSPLMEGRLFPDFAPPDTPRPFATWAQVGGSRPAFRDGAMASRRSVRIQINVWGTSRQETIETIRAIEVALCADPVYAQAEDGASATVDEAGSERGARQDFTIWGDS